MSTVLIVEDDHPTNILMQNILRSMGCSVLSTRSAPEAFEKLQTETPDLILMDIRLPGINGHEATRVIKHELNLHDIPIIAITVEDTTEDRRKATEAGMVDYITKPFRVNQFQSVITPYIKPGLIA